MRRVGRFGLMCWSMGDGEGDDDDDGSRVRRSVGWMW